MDFINNIVTEVTASLLCSAKLLPSLPARATVEWSAIMRSLNTTLVLSALRILTMFASPAFAQEPHHHHATSPARGVFDRSTQSGFQSEVPGAMPGYGVIPEYGVIPGYDSNGTTVPIPNPGYR